MKDDISIVKEDVEAIKSKNNEKKNFNEEVNADVDFMKDQNHDLQDIIKELSDECARINAETEEINLTSAKMTKTIFGKAVKEKVKKTTKIKDDFKKTSKGKSWNKW